MSISFAALAVLASSTGLSAHGAPAWRLTDTGVTAQFRGLDPVSSRVAWVAGASGTVLRTVDGGRHWQPVGPAAAAGLEFRDIEAFDVGHAVALTIGAGTDSRLYATADGGRSWTETFRNDDPAAFYDCITFLDRRHGLALSDPVDGKFRILATADGGRTWRPRPTDGMPDALPGEFAFAASGTCLVSAGGRAYFATGGGSASRVFTSRDAGRTWSVTETPVPSGPSAGIYSLAARVDRGGRGAAAASGVGGGRGATELIAVGGDYVVPASAPDGAAHLRRGREWTVSRKPPGEYRSGVAWHGRSALAVGPTGSDVSYDGGRTWKRFDDGSFDAVQCAGDGSCWASGTDGRVARLVYR